MKKFLSTITISSLVLFAAMSCNNQAENHGGSNETEVEGEHSKSSPTVAEKERLPEQENEATVIVKANKSVEYKFKLEQYEKITYEWKSDASLRYDFHGDPDAKEDYPESYFESYANGNSDHAKGMVTIPYKGSHGWYWKNESDKDITIILTTKGRYNIVGLLQ